MNTEVSVNTTMPRKTVEQRKFAEPIIIDEPINVKDPMDTAEHKLSNIEDLFHKRKLKLPTPPRQNQTKQFNEVSQYTPSAVRFNTKSPERSPSVDYHIKIVTVSDKAPR